MRQEKTGDRALKDIGAGRQVPGDSKSWKRIFFR